MVRSTTTGRSDSTTVENSATAMPGTSFTTTVARPVGGTLTTWVSGVDHMRRNRKSAVAGWSAGLASAMTTSKRAPVAPSARYRV